MKNTKMIIIKLKGQNKVSPIWKGWKKLKGRLMLT
jgi:hypothetical protein